MPSKRTQTLYGLATWLASMLDYAKKVAADVADPPTEQERCPTCGSDDPALPAQGEGRGTGQDNAGLPVDAARALSRRYGSWKGVIDDLASALAASEARYQEDVDAMRRAAEHAQDERDTALAKYEAQTQNYTEENNRRAEIEAALSELVEAVERFPNSAQQPALDKARALLDGADDAK